MMGFCRTFTVLLVCILCLTSIKAYSQCTKDSECKGARICVNGECVDAPPSSPAPKPCTKDTECPGNQVCQEGFCTDPRQGILGVPITQSTALPLIPLPEDNAAAASLSSESAAPLTQPTSSHKQRTPVKFAGWLQARFGLNFNWGRGYGIDQITSTSYGSTETYWGFRFGGGYGIKLAPFIELEPCVVLDQKGAAVYIDTDNLQLFRATYLSIPVLSYWHLPHQSKISPFISVGPVFGFCVSSMGYMSGSAPKDLSDETHGFFFGLMPGAGAALKVRSGSVVVQCGYTLDFTQIFDSVGLTDIYINSLSVEVGYRFEL